MLGWLLDGDPAVRWQVLADLMDGPVDDVAAARALVGVEGWGARLLSRQDADGRWGAALYSPKFTSTTYTLLLLMRLGLAPDDPRARLGVERLWAGASRYDGGLMLAPSVHRPEACITAMLVHLAVYFGHTEPGVDEAVSWLLAQQLPDGGWNCRSVRDGSRHGSFHTTILALEALAAYQPRGPIGVAAAIRGGQQFLLDHRLCRAHRTGELVDQRYLRFPFPPGWRYDTVRALEHFRAVDAQPDPRMTEGLTALAPFTGAEQRWPRQPVYSGRYWFTLEPPGPSRLATLRALRVLRWWCGGNPG